MYLKNRTHFENSTRNHDLSNWVEEHEDYLSQYARARIADPSIAEELVQETFLAATKAHKRFKGDSSAKTWLVSILRNKIFDTYRKRSREVTFTALSHQDADESDSADAEMWIDRYRDEEWTVEAVENLNRTEFLSQVYQGLNYLPEKTRMAFIMREIEFRSTEDICDELDISSANLWTMLHRARKHLRDYLLRNWLLVTEEQEAASHETARALEGRLMFA